MEPNELHSMYGHLDADDAEPAFALPATPPSPIGTDKDAVIANMMQVMKQQQSTIDKLISEVKRISTRVEYLSRSLKGTHGDIADIYTDLASKVTIR